MQCESFINTKYNVYNKDISFLYNSFDTFINGALLISNKVRYTNLRQGFVATYFERILALFLRIIRPVN